MSPDDNRPHTAPGRALRAARSVVGALFLLVGVAMLMLPGPGLALALLGLALLSSEFRWAAQLLDLARRQLARLHWPTRGAPAP